ncbi:hypothetical protein [Roseomonas sp. WA12]
MIKGNIALLACVALGACGTPARLATRSAEPPANYRELIADGLRANMGGGSTDYRDVKISPPFPGQQRNVAYVRSPYSPHSVPVSEHVAASAWMVCVYYKARHWLHGEQEYGEIYMIDNEGRAERAKRTSASSGELAFLSPCNRLRPSALQPLAL